MYTVSLYKLLFATVIVLFTHIQDTFAILEDGPKNCSASHTWQMMKK
jgi:hypothetical protein